MKDGPCNNEDCDICHPLPRFKISTTTLEWRTHSRDIKAASLEEALRIYNDGTAWPSDYDTRTVSVVETQPARVEALPATDPEFDMEYTCYNTAHGGALRPENLSQAFVDAMLEPDD